MLLALPMADVVLPNWQQAGRIAAVAAAHFLGQLLLNRGFNMDDATHGSAVFAQQVGSPCTIEQTASGHAQRNSCLVAQTMLRGFVPNVRM
jgi:hypothetical protein